MPDLIVCCDILLREHGGAGGEHGGGDLDEESLGSGRRQVQRVLQVYREGVRHAAR